MSETILIAGGSGMIGERIRAYLEGKGKMVKILTRDVSLTSKTGTGFFHWDPAKRTLDTRCLEGVGTIINLTGAPIADKRWTVQRRDLIYQSRVQSTRFLYETSKSNGLKLRNYVGASAVGIYGNRGNEPLNEKSPLGESDFLVKTCRDWEEAHFRFRESSENCTVLRIGVVLSNQGGALPELRRSIIGNIAAYLGRGDQYIPWIHIEDLIRIMDTVLEQHWTGVINAVGPQPVTNKEFMEKMVKSSFSRALLIPVPSILLQMVLGEMSRLVLDGQRVYPSILAEKKFQFTFPDLEKALSALAGQTS